MRITGRANPEFERNVILELTPQRLIIMPVVLGAVFLLVYLVTRHVGFAQPLASVSAGIFSILVYGLGLRSVSDSITSEVESRTWDFQRMSAIGAWKMAWGKLLGSAIFSWYGGLLCLLVYFSVYSSLRNPPPLYAAIALFLGGGLMAQTAGFLLSLDAVLNGRKGGRITSFLVSLVFITYSLNFISSAAGFSVGGKHVEWFGVSFDVWQILSGSILMFLGWGLLGCYRALKVELAYRTSPNAWAAFTIFAMFYLAGFLPGDMVGALPARVFIGLTVALGFTYWQLLTEKKNLVRYRKMIEVLTQGKLGRVYALSPRWLVSLLLSVVAAMTFYFSVLASSSEGAQNVLGFMSKSAAQAFINNISSLSLSGISFVIFAVRDAAIVLALAITSRGSRSAERTAFVYLALLYLLVPLILSMLGLKALNIFFYPALGGDPVSLIVMPMLPMSAAIALMAAAWNRENARRLSDEP